MLILKADAYGHGMVKVGQSMENICDYYGVATVEEGVLLRESGIKLPVLVMCVNQYEIEKAILYDLTISINDFIILNEYCKFKKNLHKRAKLHICMDTGMNRLGFNIKKLSQLTDILVENNIDIEGILTHYYSTEEKKIISQYSDYELAVNYIENKLNKKLVRHIASSYASINHMESFTDMIRLGIGAYGYTEGMELDKAMSVYSEVIDIRKINKGDGVGYGHKYVADKNTTIAVLSGGYADGISRAYIGYKVIINGQYVPIIAVCMDMFMVDIYNYKVVLGDRAIILGESSNHSINANDIARHINALNYEILTSYKNRIEYTYSR